MPIFDKFSISNFSSTQNIKKSLEAKNQEKAKIFGYIGMEVWDLYKQGKLDVDDLNVYFEKMELLEKEISDLESQKQRLEMQSKEKAGKTICSCGCEISSDSRFCSKCGKPVELDEIICECGKTINKDMQFCSNCGKSVESIKARLTSSFSRGEESKIMYKECICGTKVPEGQFMCMECGRKVEQ